MHNNVRRPLYFWSAWASVIAGGLATLLYGAPAWAADAVGLGVIAQNITGSFEYIGKLMEEHGKVLVVARNDAGDAGFAALQVVDTWAKKMAANPVDGVTDTAMTLPRGDSSNRKSRSPPPSASPPS